jgi:NADH-ubiquinone oxidoreductase chain 5
MYILIIYLPLISAIVGLTMGRFIGEKGMSLIGPILLIISSILSLLIYKDIIIDGYEINIQGITWMEIGGIMEINWGLKYDSLTATMLIVVLIVSTLVHIYSTEYMSGDPHKVRFISYLSLFTFFMLILVTSSNYLQLFIGWEGVGLCSYLLINFWTTRILAGKAAIKAMVVNRIGDIGLVLAMFLILWNFNSLDYSIVFSSIIEGNNFILNIIVLCILIASAGKSAQMILHTWLPDAMEGFSYWFIGPR